MPGHRDRLGRPRIAPIAAPRVAPPVAPIAVLGTRPRLTPGPELPPRRGQHGAAGQSITELALLLPVILFILLAILDFARVYTAMLSIESAAREAADHGSLYPWQWDPAYKSVTEAEMELQACTSAKSLPGYVGPDDNCVNPSFSYVLLPPPSAPSTDLDTCHLIPREDEPCRVEVHLAYDFDLIAPVNFQFFDLTIGLPSRLTFERSSTFAISDFEIDPGAP